MIIYDLEREIEMIYAVIMRRWGSQDDHSYLLGVFSNEARALEEGKKEKAIRGNKYEWDILGMELNDLTIHSRTLDISNWKTDDIP